MVPKTKHYFVSIFVSALEAIIDYWSYIVPEAGNIPAKVVLIEIPSRKELRQKNLFNVSDVSYLQVYVFL